LFVQNLFQQVFYLKLPWEITSPDSEDYKRGSLEDSSKVRRFAYKEKLPLALIIFFDEGEKVFLNTLKDFSPETALEWFRQFAESSLAEMAKRN